MQNNEKRSSTPTALYVLSAATTAAVALVILGLISIVIMAAVYFYPPLFVNGLGLLNRKPMCANAEVFRGADKHYLQTKYRQQLEGSARLVQKDPAGYDLWETARGRWWIP